MTNRMSILCVTAALITAGGVSPWMATKAAIQAPLPLPEASPPSVRAADLRITLIGTGGGPAVRLDQFGISTLVQAGDTRFLFDCGRGATIRLAQVGVRLASITRVFLTHLHSDHIVQLPDLFLTGWMAGRNVPLEVWGPEGTHDMMDGLTRAFAFDIHVRRDVDRTDPSDGINVVTHDVQEGTVFENSGVRVTAFLVDHGPVAPALGYRVDYAGHSVALSGDTRLSENLIRHATGVDVLIHEVIDPVQERASATTPTARARAERVIAHHTTPEEAGQVFARVKPRLAVYSHADPSDDTIQQTRTTYSGPLQRAEDLLTIDIGTEVTVRHFGKSR